MDTLHVLALLIAALVVSDTVCNKEIVNMMTEEDMLSFTFPEAMKCEACLAVARILSTNFGQAYKHGRQSVLSDLELVQILENSCQAETFANFGLLFDEQKRLGPVLVGPGLVPPSDVSNEAKVISGGHISDRFSDMCQAFLDMPDHYSFPEKIIYDHWLYFQGLESLKTFLCFDSVDLNRAHCLRPSQRYFDPEYDKLGAT